MRTTFLLSPLLLLGLSARGQTPFTCEDQVSYITKNASSTATTLPYTLYSTNLITGTQTPLGDVRTSDGTNLRVNGIGYNTMDNFIWGSQPGTSNILRIGSDGVATSFAVTGLPASSFTAGDVDGAGNLYLYEASGSTIYKISLTGPVYTAIPLSATGANLQDFSVNADGSKIYGVSSGNGSLVTYTISETTTTRVVTDIGFPAANFNSFMDSRGNMFIQSQGSGDVYLLDPTDETVGTPKKVQNGASMTNADGAQCRTSSVYSNAQATFGCQPGASYVLHGTTSDTTGNCSQTTDEHLYRINLQAGTFQEIYPGMTAGITYGTLNNLGYNPTDGYLWAYRYGTNQLARIGNDQTIQFFPIDGLPADCADAFGTGDFDANGIFYLMNGFTHTEIHKVDLNPSSPNYLKHLGTITLSGSSISSSVGDMSVNPADGMLYGVTVSRKLLRINPLTGVIADLGPTSDGGTRNVVAAFFDVAGTFYYQASNSSTVYQISDVKDLNGSTNPTASASRTNQTTFESGDGAACSQTLASGVLLSGNVWGDANGDRIKTESNTVTNNPSETLTVYLTDENGTIVGKSDVASDGTWKIDLVPPGTFMSRLSNNAGLEVATKNATVPSTLPDADWVHTGINFAGTAGAFGSSSGSVTVSTTDVPNLDFGLDAVPDSDNKSGTLASQPAQDAFIPLDGTVSGAQVLTGNDPEDYPSGGTLSSKAVAITSLPTNGELWYNGAKIEFGRDGTNPPSATNPYIIPSLNPSQLNMKMTGSGYTSTTFNYAYVDAASVQDPVPATYTLSFGPLPVTISSFTASKENSVVLLRWTTTSESNSWYFGVEYSTTGKEWKELGRIDTQGNSTELQQYSFTHTAPAVGQNLYRLRAVDADESFAYSTIRNVTFEVAALVQAFPNPATNLLMVNTGTPLSQIGDVKIFSTNGKQVHSAKKLTSRGIDLRSIPNGMYVLALRFKDGRSLSQKFTVTK